MASRMWKVYGADGHRQKASFTPSVMYDFSNEEIGTRMISVFNSDTLHTNDYSIIGIVRNTAEECEKELWSQISDGYFENYRTGKVEEISVEEESK